MQDFKLWYDETFAYHKSGERKNKILLAYLTSEEILGYAKRVYPDVFKNGDDDDDSELSRISKIAKTYIFAANMAELKDICIGQMYNTSNTARIRMMGTTYLPKNPEYRIEGAGLCPDGDVRCIRVIKKITTGTDRHQSEQSVNLKAGKYFAGAIEQSDFGANLPKQVKTWLCEELAKDWKTFATEQIRADLNLHIGSCRYDFEDIYDEDRLAGDFHSCMVGAGFTDFYADSVSAKAAWLENADCEIVARCVIFTDVLNEDTGEHLRLAERQYATEDDLVLKQILVNKLIEAGEIDAYKVIGADCHSPERWISAKGEKLPTSCRFSIDCNIPHDGIHSYQDSFKWYDYDKKRAYNYEEDGADLVLENHSDGTFYSSDFEYDEYHDRFVHRWVYAYYNGSQIYLDEFDTDGFVDFNGDLVFEDDIHPCPQCGEDYANGLGYYSPITEKQYCCQSCRIEAEEDFRKSHWEDSFTHEWNTNDVSKIEGYAMEFHSYSAFVSVSKFTATKDSFEQKAAKFRHLTVNGKIVFVINMPIIPKLIVDVVNGQYNKCIDVSQIELYGWYFSEITNQLYYGKTVRDVEELRYKNKYWYYCDYDDTYVEDSYYRVSIWVEESGRLVRHTISWDSICKKMEDVLPDTTFRYFCTGRCAVLTETANLNDYNVAEILRMMVDKVDSFDLAQMAIRHDAETA